MKSFRLRVYSFALPYLFIFMRRRIHIRQVTPLHVCQNSFYVLQNSLICASGRIDM